MVMMWFVSKEIDSDAEIQHRKKFYSNLTGNEIFIKSSVEAGYILSDGRNDNRCMIIGHTDTVYAVLGYLRSKSPKKYKVYICSCAMEKDVLKRLIDIFGNAASVFLSEQDIIRVRELSTSYKDGVTVCEFLDKTYTRLGFRATRSELNMYNSPLKGFYHKLEKNFVKL